MAFGEHEEGLSFACCVIHPVESLYSGSEYVVWVFLFRFFVSIVFGCHVG